MQHCTHKKYFYKEKLFIRKNYIRKVQTTLFSTILILIELEFFVHIASVSIEQECKSLYTDYTKPLLRKNFCAPFPNGAPRRTDWLPASVSRGRAAGPATASVNLLIEAVIVT